MPTPSWREKAYGPTAHKHLRDLEPESGAAPAASSQPGDDDDHAYPDWHRDRLGTMPLPHLAELVESMRPEPTVPGLCMRGSVGLLVAQPHMGKSLLLLDLAIAATLGEAWLGIPLAPMPVTYLGLDCPAWDMRAMATCLLAGRGLKLDDDRLAPLMFQCRERCHRINIMETRDIDAIVDAVQRNGSRMVLIDCFSNVNRADESARDEMEEVMASLRDIARRTNATVLLSDHTPVVANTRATGSSYVVRGSGVKTADADFVWALGKAAGRMQLDVVKARGFLSAGLGYQYTVDNDDSTGSLVTRLTVHDVSTAESRAGRKAGLDKVAQAVLQSPARAQDIADAVLADADFTGDEEQARRWAQNFLFRMAKADRLTKVERGVWQWK